jgi:hypothetical protein
MGMLLLLLIGGWFLWIVACFLFEVVDYLMNG